MSEKTREICTVVSQESIGAGIYSMWIQTDCNRYGKEKRRYYYSGNGQFIGQIHLHMTSPIRSYSFTSNISTSTKSPSLSS